MEGVEKQPETTRLDGTRLDEVPQGVVVRDLVTHVDQRGSLTELFHPDWGFHPDPVVHAYMFTIRPGITKGWGVHRKASDRYALLFGEVMVVLYDARDDSPTEGMVAEVFLSHHRRQLMVIPSGIWHANTNIGSTDAVLLNFKTEPYDHAHPDKYLLPLDTDQIPYTFRAPVTGW